jgi:sugar phosphate isomerase/epimerase
MKISFSTLACPDWPLSRVLDEAQRLGFNGVELRFINGTDALWELPEFSASRLQTTKRGFVDRGLAVASVDARAHFHFPDGAKRKEQIEEAKRNIDLAAALGSRGVRIWGDKVQPGADRTSTMKWISESIWTLAEYGRPRNVSVWLESHGDFTASKDVLAILRDCGCHGAGATWDPANAVVGCGEDPGTGAANLGPYIEHVHFKDEKRLPDGKWQIMPVGQGSLPVGRIVNSLRDLKFQGFLSFEWEKKWHPEIAPAEVALPQFIEWFKKWKASS